MSIIIRNLGGDPLGVTDYELRINDRRIATFKHNRRDGLGVCLQKAAAAAEKAKWMQAAEFFEAVREKVKP